jgi:hypothetical protein
MKVKIEYWFQIDSRFCFFLEINQQILDAQSAQNMSNNNDNGTDSGIQRTRSSITRTLLMNSG